MHPQPAEGLCEGEGPSRPLVMLKYVASAGMSTRWHGQVQPSPRLAVLLRSPKLAWQRADHDWGTARILTKWGLASFQAGLEPSFGNKLFGKVQEEVRPSEGKAPTGIPAIDEDEECKVQ